MCKFCKIEDLVTPTSERCGVPRLINHQQKMIGRYQRVPTESCNTTRLSVEIHCQLRVEDNGFVLHQQPTHKPIYSWGSCWQSRVEDNRSYH